MSFTAKDEVEKFSAYACDVFPYQDLLSHSKLIACITRSLLSAVEELYLYPLVNVPHQLHAGVYEIFISYQPIVYTKENIITPKKKNL